MEQSQAVVQTGICLSAERDLGVLVGSKLTWIQQYALAAPKVNGAMPSVETKV